MKGHSREVAVFVRIRPSGNFAHDLIQCLPDGQTIKVAQRKESRKLSEYKESPLSSWSFQLQGVFHLVSQGEVYRQVCRHVVLGALDGYNGTVMCFGQTGAGKTYTMTGSMESYKQRGIIPRALQEVFKEVEKRTDQAFSVYLSYLEIYNENMMDLLSSLQTSQRLPARGMVVVEEPGRGVVVRGLSLHPVHNEEEALNLLFEGEMNRVIGSHALNRKSSRSHCILTLQIESHSRTLSDAKYITSKLNLVDLAGSERLGKTGSEGQLLKEAVYINKSLSFLEQAILALADRRRDHVPFRQSKLTHALKDSLGGNCNTVLVANIYGEAAQIEETLSTLRFACRMKRVQTNPVLNENMDPAVQIKKLQREIQMLRDELSIHDIIVGRAGVSYGALSKAQLAEVQRQVQSYLEGSLQEISIVSIRQVQAVFAEFKLAVQMQEEKVKAQLQLTNNLDTRRSPEDDAVSCGMFTKSRKQTKAPASNRAKTKKSNDKLSQSKGQEEGTPVSKKRSESASKSKLNLVSTPGAEDESEEPEPDGQDTQDSQLPTSEPFNQGSPSSKAEAFEDFKLGPGGKINTIFKENKAVLRERRCLLRQLTQEVNSVKREMDRTTATLQQQEEMSSSPGQYLVMNGDTALQESRDSLLVKLRELKACYRQRYEAVRNIKDEVNYCQHLVDQCRIRLLSEFETWFEQSSSLIEETALKENCIQGEDRLSTDSSSPESFYNATQRTLRQKGRVQGGRLQALNPEDSIPCEHK